MLLSKVTLQISGDLLWWQQNNNKQNKVLETSPYSVSEVIGMA